MIMFLLYFFLYVYSVYIFIYIFCIYSVEIWLFSCTLIIMPIFLTQQIDKQYYIIILMRQILLKYCEYIYIFLRELVVISVHKFDALFGKGKAREHNYMSMNYINAVLRGIKHVFDGR